MTAAQTHRRTIPWLELLLVLSAIVLVFQLFPVTHAPAWRACKWLLYVVDVRNWSWAVFGWFNVLVAILLIAVRFGPEIRKGLAANRPSRKPGIQPSDIRRTSKDARNIEEHLRCRLAGERYRKNHERD